MQRVPSYTRPCGTSDFLFLRQHGDAPIVPTQPPNPVFLLRYRLSGRCRNRLHDSTPRWHRRLERSRQVCGALLAAPKSFDISGSFVDLYSIKLAQPASTIKQMGVSPGFPTPATCASPREPWSVRSGKSMLPEQLDISPHGDRRPALGPTPPPRRAACPPACPKTPPPPRGDIGYMILTASCCP